MCAVLEDDLLAATPRPPVTDAEVARYVGYLVRHGATFRSIDGWPDWYEAQWFDPYVEDNCRSAYAISDRYDAPFARAFKLRADASNVGA